MQKLKILIAVFSSYALCAMEDLQEKDAAWKALIGIALSARNSIDDLLHEPSEQAYEREMRSLKRAANIQGKKYCSICDRTYRSITYFNNHMAMHEGTSKYICEYCEKPFPQGCNLQRHYSRCSKKH